MARRYQHTMELLPQIKEMLAKGTAQKQAEDALGSSGYRPVHELLKRGRTEEGQDVWKQRGRKPAKTLAGYKSEDKRLKMGDAPLRGLLRSTGRKCVQMCKSNVFSHISAQVGVPGVGHVPDFWSIQEWSS